MGATQPSLAVQALLSCTPSVTRLECQQYIDEKRFAPRSQASTMSEISMLKNRLAAKREEVKGVTADQLSLRHELERFSSLLDMAAQDLVCAFTVRQVTSNCPHVSECTESHVVTRACRYCAG